MLISSVDPGFGLPRLRQKLNDDNLNIETIGLLEKYFVLPKRSFS